MLVSCPGVQARDYYYASFYADYGDLGKFDETL